MIVAILAGEFKQEIEKKVLPGDVEIIWVDSLQSLRMIEADAYFDFEYENNPDRVSGLMSLLPKPVFINDVGGTCADTENRFIRINGWPTMIERDALEIACPDHLRKLTIDIFGTLAWRIIEVPDVSGMVTPRIISMIINEAFFALGEEVSVREQIDTAMKLGTNYPLGPFEWLEKIGRERVVALLRRLSHTDPRYTVAPLLDLQ